MSAKHEKHFAPWVLKRAAFRHVKLTTRLSASHKSCHGENDGFCQSVRPIIKRYVRLNCRQFNSIC